MAESGLAAAAHLDLMVTDIDSTDAIRVTRVVPLEGALTAAVENMRDEEPREETFPHWYSEKFSLNRMGAPSVDLDEAEALIADCPDSALGRHWKAAAQAALEATRVDEFRPFDRVEVPATLAAAFDDLASEIERRSPLLVSVAEAVRNALPSGPLPTSIGDIVEHLDVLTGPEITPVNQDGWCDKHEEYCYSDGESRGYVLWADVDMLLPGLSARVHGLVDRMLSALPPVGAFDNGAARKVRP